MNICKNIYYEMNRIMLYIKQINQLIIFLRLIDI